MARRRKAVRPPRHHLHAYIPGGSQEWDGSTRCGTCDQPRRNRVHNYTPAVDDTDRIIGEGGQ